MSTPVHLAGLALGSVLALSCVPLLLELLVLSPAALLSPRRVRTRPHHLSTQLAVVVPAHNEERLVGECVRSLRASDPCANILVVAHNCSDSTAGIAEAGGARALILNDGLGGKGRALHFGFTHALAAGATAVLVVDADSVVTPGLLPVLSECFAAGADALQCRYQAAQAHSPRGRLAALALLGMNVLRPRGRSRLGLSCGIFGNGFALSAATLRRVPYTANSLVEDLEYHIHLLGAGVRVQFLDSEAVLGEMPEKSSAAATQRARWEGGRLLMRRAWAVPLARRAAAGEWRMLEPLLDLLAFPLATELLFLLIVSAAGLVLHSTPLLAFGAAGLTILALYLVAAASLSAEPLRTLGSVAGAPAFLLWKLMTLPGTRRAAQRSTAWVRTSRNAE